MDRLWVNWVVLAVFGLVMFLLSPSADKENPEEQFFKGRDRRGKPPGAFLLTSSVLIAWIFAKSIQNCSDLGRQLGLPGGVAYAAYWLAFVVAGVLLYRLRNMGFTSIHQFLRTRFGQRSVWLFSLILLVRLWNEIWSNTMVMAQYFGPRDGAAYYTATWAVTAVILAYILKGGLRSSIVTDMVQMLVAALVLFLILGYILPAGKTRAILESGRWTLAGGVDLILVALIQVFSYPFQDPVMTDRAFVTDNKTMLKSFLTAGVLGVLFITLFSFVGIYARVAGITGNSTFETAKSFGFTALAVMNVMMLTSGASTIDSTFSSTGKLVALELLGGLEVPRVAAARVSMVVLAILGNLMVHADPAILSATTVSGTMVLGLTPVFLLAGWRRAGAASYYASVGLGLFFGLGLALHWFTSHIGTGHYGTLLWVNAVGVSACFAAYLLGALLFPSRR